MDAAEKAEATAALVIEGELGVTALRRDLGGGDGRHDFDLHYPDGRPDGALEVTLATHPDLVEMQVRLGNGGNVVHTPDLDLNWTVWLRHPRVRIDRIQPRLTGHLQRLEADGVEAVGHPRGRRRDPMLDQLPVVAAIGYRRADPTIPARAVICRPMQGASSNPRFLFDAVQAEIARKTSGSLRRAADDGYEERHLFIVADTTWRLDIEQPLRYHRPHEIPAPIPPESMTQVWLAADVLHDGGHRLVVWTAPRGQPWRSVDVALRDVMRTVT